MIAQVPDVTRLLDRLEDAGLIARERQTTDRRQVLTVITEKGLSLLAELDEPVAAMHKRALGHMSAEQLQQLTELLAIARAGV
jgi:DNA-binding MarR family transcriptional regulator